MHCSGRGGIPKDGRVSIPSKFQRGLVQEEQGERLGWGGASQEHWVACRAPGEWVEPGLEERSTGWKKSLREGGEAPDSE